MKLTKLLLLLILFTGCISSSEDHLIDDEKGGSNENNQPGNGNGNENVPVIDFTGEYECDADRILEGPIKFVLTKKTLTVYRKLGSSTHFSEYTYDNTQISAFRETPENVIIGSSIIIDYKIIDDEITLHYAGYDFLKTK